MVNHQQETGAQRTLKVGLLGCGTVGTEVARALLRDAEVYGIRARAALELVGIAVRNVETPRAADIPRSLLTADAEALIDQSDIVIELIGGIDPARSYLQRALSRGASVVTANKALIAEHGPELFAIAKESGVQLSYEAAVAGAIPIIRPIRDSLSGDNVKQVLGIVNGTTNFILDRMHQTGSTFEDALAEATELGYAEADPTADIEGYDAAAKAAILASLAFHTEVSLSDVHREGMSKITKEDIAVAAEAGYVIKLLAICSQVDHGGKSGVVVRVHPTMVPNSHPLAGVHGAFNAVFVESELAGDLMFYGQGAGGAPTAAAVLGDVITTAKRIAQGGGGVAESSYANLPVLGLDAVTTRYHVVLTVADKPGVLAVIASAVADRGVSIERVRQSALRSGVESAESTENVTAEQDAGEPLAELVVATHAASDAALSETVRTLSTLDVVHSVSTVLRVEGE